METAQRASAVESSELAALERTAIAAHLSEDPIALKAVDVAVELQLRAGYSQSLDTAAGHERVVRTALVHWARLVRLHLDQALHTRVPALVEDPQCAGSVVGDAVLLDYVDTAAGNGARTRGVVAALHGLARHTSCLGEAQHAELALAMALAYDDVRHALVLNRLEGALPYVVQALFEPMLIVHESERQHGLDGPLADWFRTHRALLREGARNKRHPAWWHGLWVYDRTLGRLRGFKAVPYVEDENTVNLVAFVETLAKPGVHDLRCSYAEMIQRGVRDGRYACLGQVCKDSSDPACVAERTEGNTAPNEKEREGLMLPGLMTTSMPECIATHAVSPVTKQLRCMIEASGFVASPIDRLTKDLQSVAMAGVKIGPGCGIAMTAGEKQAWDAYNAAADAARQAYDAAIDASNDYIDIMTEALRQSQEALAAATKIYNDNPTPANATAKATAETNVKTDEDNVNAAIEQRAKDEALAKAQREAALKAAEEARKKALEAERQKQQQQQQQTTGSGSAGTGSAGTGSGGGSGSATPTEDPAPQQCSDPESCANHCSARGRALTAFEQCFEETPDPTDPLISPLGCNGDCDPIEPEGGAPNGAACLAELELNDPAGTSERCWAVMCGPSDDGAQTHPCCGGQGMTAGGAPQLPSMCEAVRCESGAPTFEGGACQCGGPVAPGGGLLPPTPAPHFPMK